MEEINYTRVNEIRSKRRKIYLWVGMALVVGVLVVIISAISHRSSIKTNKAGFNIKMALNFNTEEFNVEMAENFIDELVRQIQSQNQIILHKCSQTVLMGLSSFERNGSCVRDEQIIFCKISAPKLMITHGNKANCSLTNTTFRVLLTRESIQFDTREESPNSKTMVKRNALMTVGKVGAEVVAGYVFEKTVEYAVDTFKDTYNLIGPSDWDFPPPMSNDGSYAYHGMPFDTSCTFGWFGGNSWKCDK